MWYFTSSAINSPLIGMWHWIGTHLFWRFSPVRDNVIIYPHHSVELILELTIIIHNFIWTVPGLSRKQTIRPTTGFFVLDRLYPIDISHCRILNLSTYILSWPSRSIKKSSWLLIVFIRLIVFIGLIVWFSIVPWYITRWTTETISGLHYLR